MRVRVVIDFGKSRLPPYPVQVEGVDVETVCSYRYLRLVLDDKLDWFKNTDHLYCLPLPILLSLGHQGYGGRQRDTRVYVYIRH